MRATEETWGVSIISPYSTDLERDFFARTLGAVLALNSISKDMSDEQTVPNILMQIIRHKRKILIKKNNEPYSIVVFEYEEEEGIAYVHIISHTGKDLANQLIALEEYMDNSLNARHMAIPVPEEEEDIFFLESKGFFATVKNGHRFMTKDLTK